MPSMNLDRLSLHKSDTFDYSVNRVESGDILIYAKCGLIDDILNPDGYFRSSEMPGMSFTGHVDWTKFLTENFRTVDLFDTPLTFVVIEHPSQNSWDCYVSNDHVEYGDIDDTNIDIDVECSEIMNNMSKNRNISKQDNTVKDTNSCNKSVSKSRKVNHKICDECNKVEELPTFHFSTTCIDF